MALDVGVDVAVVWVLLADVVTVDVAVVFGSSVGNTGHDPQRTGHFFLTIFKYTSDKGVPFGSVLHFGN